MFNACIYLQPTAIEVSAVQGSPKDNTPDPSFASAKTKLLTLTNNMLQSLKSSVAETTSSNNSSTVSSNLSTVASIPPGNVMQLPMIIPQGESAPNALDYFVKYNNKIIVLLCLSIQSVSLSREYFLTKVVGYTDVQNQLHIISMDRHTDLLSHMN